MCELSCTESSDADNHVFMVSHAQQFEDIMLWRALGNIPNGLYIDIGVCDPSINSVSLLFYEHGWRGIHVEPSPQRVAALRRARPDEKVIEAAVGSVNQKNAHLYRVNETALRELSTLDGSVKEKFNSQGILTKTLSVATITIDDVFNECNHADIHWLKIHAEGYEGRIIEGWNSERRPWILVIERITPLENEPNINDWETRLTSLGYAFVWFDGINRFYVHENHRELARHFTTPVNAHDRVYVDGFSGFGRMMEERRLAELASMSAEIETISAKKEELQALVLELKADRERLTGQNKQPDQDTSVIKLNWARLVDEKKRIEHYCKVISNDFKAVSQKNEMLTTERNALSAERNVLSASLAVALQERDGLAAASRSITAEKKRLTTEVKKITARHHTARIMNKRYAEDIDRLIKDRDERVRILNSLQAELHALRERLASLETSSRELERDRKHLRSENAYLVEKSQRLEQDNALLEKDVRDRLNTINDLSSRLDASQSRIEAFLQSNSWRLTGPLRVFSSLLKRPATGKGLRSNGSVSSKKPKKLIVRLKDKLRTMLPGVTRILKNNTTIYRLYYRLAYGRLPPSQVALQKSNWRDNLPSSATKKYSERELIIHAKLIRARNDRNGIDNGLAPCAEFIYARLKAQYKAQNSR